MTSREKKTNVGTGQSKNADRFKRFLASFAWLALAPLLTSCVGNIISPIPTPVPSAPKQQDAWLSFKFQSPNGAPGCGSYQNETCGLKDDVQAFAYYLAPGVLDRTSANLLCPGVTDQVCNYTLQDWLNFTGFATASKVVRGVYFNKLDLQFGRDMNCWQNGQTIACYVTNYGPPPANPTWPNRAQALDDAFNHTHPPFATVAMLYNAANAGNQVSFYVFNHDKASNPFDPATVPLVLEAALDNEGGKTVPRMCMGCHGGSYTQADVTHTAAVNGAQFLPFDVVSFGLEASNSQQQAFLDLNAFVLATKPNQAIVDFVNGTYKDLGGVGAPFTQDVTKTNIYDFVPDTWKSDNTRAALYASNVRTYCRMCHLAQSRDFATFDNFAGDAGLIEAYVCGNGDMPHMEVPFGPQTNTNLSQQGIGLWLDVDPQARKDLHDFLVSVNPNGQTACPPN